MTWLARVKYNHSREYFIKSSETCIYKSVTDKSLLNLNIIDIYISHTLVFVFIKYLEIF